MYDLDSFYKEILKMNLLVKNEPTNKEKIKVYKALTKEESGEILEAVVYKDPVLLLDGMIDTLVVGSFLSLLENPSYNFGSHFIHWKSIPQEEKVANFVTLINFLIHTHEDGFFEKNVDKIISLVEKNAGFLAFDFLDGCKEVMRSNFTKFPKSTDNVNIEKEIEHIESQGRYTGVYTKHVIDIEGIERIVFYNDKDKFIKPSMFEDPYLKDKVNNENIIEESIQHLDLPRIEKIVAKLKKNNVIGK